MSQIAEQMSSAILDLRNQFRVQLTGVIECTALLFEHLVELTQGLDEVQKSHFHHFSQRFSTIFVVSNGFFNGVAASAGPMQVRQNSDGVIRLVRSKSDRRSLGLGHVSVDPGLEGPLFDAFPRVSDGFPCFQLQKRISRPFRRSTPPCRQFGCMRRLTWRASQMRAAKGGERPFGRQITALWRRIGDRPGWRSASPTLRQTTDNIQIS